MLPGGVIPAPHEQLDNARGRRGSEPRRPDEKKADVLRMEAVDVLQNRHPRDRFRSWDLRREGLLDEDATSRWILVERTALCEETGLRWIRRETSRHRRQAHFLGRPRGHLGIQDGSGIVACN